MMDELILSERQRGKTTRLIELCAKDDYSLIVCPTRAMVQDVMYQAKRMNIRIPMPITIEEFVAHKFYHQNINNFYFDELQMSLDILAGHVPIKAAVIDTSHITVTNLY